MKYANIFSPSSAPLSVTVLVLNATNTLSLACVLDPMRAANRRAGKPLFSWEIATASSEETTLTSGIPIPSNPLQPDRDRDLLVIVAGFQLEQQCTQKLLNTLRIAAGNVSGICGVDGGPWILARAGLLDGCRATIHWEDWENLEQRFPTIEVTRDRFTVDRRVSTSGGAGPALDMMLELIRARYGDALAMRTAGALIYEPSHDGARPQSLTSPARLALRAPKVAKAILHMEQSLEDPPSIAEIARALGMTTRGLEVKFKSAIGQSPGAYFLALRLSEAQRLATDTALPVAEISVMTGFSSPASFARAFKKQHGQSVQALRRAR